MLFASSLSILLGAFLIRMVIYQSLFHWYLPGIAFIFIGFYLILDFLSTWIEEKEIHYFIFFSSKQTSLYRIKTNNSQRLKLVSAMSKFPYYALLTFFCLSLFLLSALFLNNYFYLNNNFNLFAGINTSVLALFLSITGIKFIQDNLRFILIDKNKEQIFYNTLITKQIQTKDFSHFKQVIIESSIDTQDHFKQFIDPIYSIYLETFKGEKIIIEKTIHVPYVKKLIHSLGELLEIKILNLCPHLQLTKLRSKKLHRSKKASSRPKFFNLTYGKNDHSESFSWKIKTSFKLLSFELFLLILTLGSLFYGLEFVPVDKQIDILIIFSALTLILMLFFIKNHLSWEKFIFTEQNLIHQVQVLSWITEEKKIAVSEIQELNFLFDDTVIEGKNSYLSGHLAKLNQTEKQWLERRWHELLNLPPKPERYFENNRSI